MFSITVFRLALFMFRSYKFQTVFEGCLGGGFFVLSRNFAEVIKGLLHSQAAACKCAAHAYGLAVKIHFFIAEIIFSDTALHSAHSIGDKHDIFKPYRFVYHFYRVGA